MKVITATEFYSVHIYRCNNIVNLKRLLTKYEFCKEKYQTEVL